MTTTMTKTTMKTTMKMTTMMTTMKMTTEAFCRLALRAVFVSRRLAPRPAGAVSVALSPSRAVARTSSLAFALMSSLAFALISSFAAPRAQAQFIEAPAARVAEVPTGRVVLSAGGRSTRVSGAGYAPFSENKALFETDFNGFWRVSQGPKHALYVGAAVGWGVADAQARSATGHLDTFRAELAGQGLYAFRPFLFGVGRIGLGALSRTATLTGESAGAFSQKVWAPAADATVSLAARIPSNRVDFWLAVEGGYRYAPSRRVVLSRAAERDGQTLEAIDLGSLSLGGPSVGARVGIFF